MFRYIGDDKHWDRIITMWECIGWMYARQYWAKLGQWVQGAPRYIQMSATIGRIM